MLKQVNYSSITIILFLAAYFPKSIAQTSTLDFGASLPIFLKANIVQPSNGVYSLFGRSGLDAVLKIGGADEHAMSFMQIIGWEFDETSFTLAQGHMLRTTAHCINVNPSCYSAANGNL